METLTDQTLKLVQYLKFINERYPKRKISVEKVGEKFTVMIQRDDFGNWSADNGWIFDSEQELASFLEGFIAFYDCVSHTTRRA